MMGVTTPADLGDITEDDALLVIDMQCDFVPQHSVDNPDGGRFGVAEGDHIVLACVQLIEHFVAKGGYVAATRDYHPHDHVSFVSEGGPFPVHCVQGSPGSHFMPEIARALAAGKRKARERVHVAFKAMHEDVDSFGGLPYFDGGVDRISTRGTGRDQSTAAAKTIGCCMGCSKAPWTGSMLLKQSAIEYALDDASPGAPLPDMNAPPDAFACVDDGRERFQSLKDALCNCKRVFVCGLALDFCVLDTCLNAVNQGCFQQVAMILDAARASYIPGIGSFNGFLSDPTEVMRKLTDAKVSLCSVESVTGTSPTTWVEEQPRFPDALGPFALTTTTSLEIKIVVYCCLEPCLLA